MELKWPIRYEATKSKPLNSIIVYEKSMQQLNVNERLPDMTPLLNVLSEWLLFNTKLAIYQLSWREQVTFQWDDHDDDVYFELDQHIKFDFYTASSLKQQSTWPHYPDTKPSSLCSYSLMLHV